MTERQKRFAEYYLEMGNARQAAIRAGYSASYAEHVKRRKEVKEYLEKRIGGMDESRVASADEILEFLTEVMRTEGVEDKGVGTRMKAAEMIAKRMGYFAAEGGAQGARAVIVDDIPDGADEA
ncbi:MAG: terminase small subunit [Christensenellales bacterium]